MNAFIDSHTMSVVEFNVRDIASMHIEISFDEVKLETLRDRLTSIERGHFMSGTVTTDTLLQFVDRHVPSLRLAGKGFEISVYRDSIKLTISTQVENMPRMSMSETSISQEELFAGDNLQKINVDFSAIVGHVLGRLGIGYDATKFTIRINLRKSGVRYHANVFGKEAIPTLQSLVGESAKIQSVNPEFKTREVFLGRQAEAYYDLHTQKPPHGSRNDKVVFFGWVSFENMGVEDLNMILDAYLKRVNDIVEKLAGGLETNE